VVLETAKSIFARVPLDTAVSVRLPPGHCAHVLRVSGTTPPEYFALTSPGVVDQATEECVRRDR
jgi:hypothetical protein